MKKLVMSLAFVCAVSFSQLAVAGMLCESGKLSPEEGQPSYVGNLQLDDDLKGLLTVTFSGGMAMTMQLTLEKAPHSALPGSTAPQMVGSVSSEGLSVELQGSGCFSGPMATVTLGKKEADGAVRLHFYCKYVRG